MKSFIDRWENAGDEKSDTQKFWLELLRDVLSIDNPEDFITFEKRVNLGHVSYIDGYIPSTGIIIEQKSSTVNLDAPAKQSDGTLATPFEQAKRYYDWLPASQRGRYIIVSNFREIRIHDMETPKAPPEILTLSEITPANTAFLVKRDRPLSHEELISLKAGELVGKLYDSLISRFAPDDTHSQQTLNVFCVRLVFLLYAEDSGLFRKSQFHDYLKPRELVASDALLKLFDVLNQKPEERSPYLHDDLKAFPYVNGELFAENDIDIPQLTGEPLRIILEDMSEGFDWSGISPTIFGALFESTLNPETRHTGGMHYTSIENIHKVIDPLFMDGLNAEFDKADNTKKLLELQKKLASMQFFDPACGSGNFLTETYLSLRRLENRILAELSQQISFASDTRETNIQVSIGQFYGIEINDFAVSVARTALWIAESQMWNETRKITHFIGDILPLKTYSSIKKENALTYDWNQLIKPRKDLYIISNPPFMGYSVQTKEQKAEITSLYGQDSQAGKIDYVAGWYYKASKFIQGTRARAAFVSTNSITQGEQVNIFFRPLRDDFGIHIDFAHTAFKWDSEAKDKAHVHVVVIGFNAIEEEEGPEHLKRLYTPEGLKLVEHINFYLVPAPDVWNEARPVPWRDDTPRANLGSIPRDGGNLLLTEEEKTALLKSNPIAEKLIRPYMGSREFIRNIPRYCLWLANSSPKDIRSCPKVMERIKKVKKFRSASKRAATKKQAETPALFSEIRYSDKKYIAIPEVSSEKRNYIPIGWLDAEVIPGHIYVIPDAELYHFGVLTSRVHMAWTRYVCGRLKSDYSYSNTVVYNTFVWPSPTGKQKAMIERTARAILDARANHPECSFADLYEDDVMPQDLREAHRENDSAVCRAYGWSEDIPESEIVAELFSLCSVLRGEAEE